MSTYKNFAVVGYGGLAVKIVGALAQKKTEGAIDSVVVLTRSDKAREELERQGVALRTVSDYNDSSALEAALRSARVDVVISTINAFALGVQPTLARAAKAAGVRLFVPSDFGSSTDGHTEGLFGAKESMKTSLREIGLPFASFVTGIFTDTVLGPAIGPAFGFDFVNNKFTVAGDGETPISFTYTPDIAQYIAHVLTKLPTNQLEWRVFRIEGERTTWNDILSSWASHIGKDVEITHTPISEMQKRVAANPEDFIAFLHIVFAEGNGLVGAPEDVSNALWPEWKPKSVLQALAELYKQ